VVKAQGREEAAVGRRPGRLLEAQVPLPKVVALKPEAAVQHLRQKLKLARHAAVVA
jgi:hypothetical protein